MVEQVCAERLVLGFVRLDAKSNLRFVFARIFHNHSKVLEEILDGHVGLGCKLSCGKRSGGFEFSNDGS